MNDIASDVANRIADELASCGVKLVASLPDNWLIGVIKAIDRDERFVHVPVNREEIGGRPMLRMAIRGQRPIPAMALSG